MSQEERDSERGVSPRGDQATDPLHSHYMKNSHNISMQSSANYCILKFSRFFTYVIHSGEWYLAGEGLHILKQVILPSAQRCDSQTVLRGEQEPR